MTCPLLMTPTVHFKTKTKTDQRLHSRGPNSWTCVLVPLLGDEFIHHDWPKTMESTDGLFRPAWFAFLPDVIDDWWFSMFLYCYKLLFSLQCTLRHFFFRASAVYTWAPGPVLASLTCPCARLNIAGPSTFSNQTQNFLYRSITILRNDWHMIG